MKTISQIVTLLLLGAVLQGTGAFCFLPAEPVPAHHAACHPVPVPSSPQPADYKCCASRDNSALLTNVFTPRPVLQALAAKAIPVSVAMNGDETFRCAPTLSNGPPDILVLRI